MDGILKMLTRKSLATHNGRGKTPAFIAFEGKIYDVSSIFINGEHNGCMAGNDLTDILPLMPHGAAVLQKTPVVGELVD